MDCRGPECFGFLASHQAAAATAVALQFATAGRGTAAVVATFAGRQSIVGLAAVVRFACCLVSSKADYFGELDVDCNCSAELGLKQVGQLHLA